MAILAKASLFPEELVAGMINKVQGKSALANLSGQTPVAFTGNKLFTFDLDKEIEIVAENAAKSDGGATVTAKTITPVKVHYSMRTSDEFLNAAEDYQLGVLEAFSEGFARKLARGFDIMAFHGTNPRTGDESNIITSDFDTDVTGNIVERSSSETATPDASIESAIAMIQASSYDPTGAIFAPGMRSALAQMVDSDGRKVYPELAWGAAPAQINGLPIQVTDALATVGNAQASTDYAVIGDFANYFRWGYAKQIPIEVIEYGDPDNTGVDLKGYNQVCIRGEAYLGWAVLEPSAFAIIKQEA